MVSWNLVYKQWKPSCAGASPRPRRKRRSLAEVITTDVDEDSVLLSLDYLVEAHLAYLSKIQVGRRWRFERFKFEVIDQNTYLPDESKNMVKELIDDVKICRSILKDKVL